MRILAGAGGLKAWKHGPLGKVAPPTKPFTALTCLKVPPHFKQKAFLTPGP